MEGHEETFLQQQSCGLMEKVEPRGSTTSYSPLHLRYVIYWLRDHPLMEALVVIQVHDEISDVENKY